MLQTIHIQDSALVDVGSTPTRSPGQDGSAANSAGCDPHDQEGTAMDGITISTDRIATAAMGVSDVGALLGREIGAMGDLLTEIRSGWQSDSAAPRFAATMQDYLDQATQLKDALLAHGATLLATGHRFNEAEHILADGMRGGR
jgi:uncharacterized protein YukE